jgi:hypothetical protein
MAIAFVIGVDYTLGHWEKYMDPARSIKGRHSLSAREFKIFQ